MADSPSMEDLLNLKRPTLKVLNDEQVSSFMKHGFLRLPGAIPLDKCDWWTRNIWARLGMDPDDKTTWHTERNHMAKHGVVAAKEIAPVAWAAICELCGGEDRVAAGGEMWTDGFIVNLGSEETEGKQVPPKELDNWHVDGDFFVHFLDSPEQALLVIPCWSDVEENSGATWISDQGPKLVGQLLYDHPEGLNPMMNPRGTQIRHEDRHDFFNNLVKTAPDESFFEMTGHKGDVILLHPLTLHSASKNGRRSVRIITNPPLSMAAPFRFHRPEDPTAYSLVELKTIQDLGGPEKFTDWKITGERHMFPPDRLAGQQKLYEREIANLRSRGLEVADTPFSQMPHLMMSLLKQQQERQQQQEQLPARTALAT